MTSPRADGLVIASVPSGHPYVRRLAAVDGVGPVVHRLPDPHPEQDPRGADRPAVGPWWPPVMLDPDWVETHDFDLMHVHFGFDDRTPAQLRALVAALRRRGRPLVLTVHDLRSPHQPDPRALDAQLDVLVPAADVVLTLTDAAADAVARRWGRRPLVVAHPHVVDLDHLDRVRTTRAAAPRSGVARVGVAAKSLRPNTDPARLLPALRRVTAPDVRLVVSLHREVHEAPATPRAARLVRTLDAAHTAGDLDLVVHDPLGDVELWDAVAALDVAVLPYRFGTHSGWLEMCHDLGTSVVAPSFGHYADQGVEGVYRAADAWVDDDSLVEAVRVALVARARDGLPGLDAERRRAQQREVSSTHDEVYAEALLGVRGAA